MDDEIEHTCLVESKLQNSYLLHEEGRGCPPFLFELLSFFMYGNKIRRFIKRQCSQTSVTKDVFSIKLNLVMCSNIVIKDSYCSLPTNCTSAILNHNSDVSLFVFLTYEHFLI